MVPINLGLIDGPFVPHNLISTQESPVPLLKFQTAPRLKILMAPGSKKGTQIYFSFLSKVLANKTPPGSPTGSLWRKRGTFTGHFAYLSKTSFFGFPSKGALPQGPLYGIPCREMPQHYSPPSVIYQSSQYMSTPPPIPGSPRSERGPHGERCLYPETFLTYLPGSPVKELPLRPSPRSPLHPSLKVPNRRALLQVTQTGPLQKEMPVSRAFTTYLSGSPAREPSLQVPFTQLPQRETHS